MRIAICDDDVIFTDAFCSLIKNELSRQGILAECICFYNGKDLIQSYYQNKFETLFLDINLTQTSGFFVAKKIASDLYRPKIIFVTNRDDLVFQSFQYQPFAFIRKKYLEIEIREVIQRLNKSFTVSKHYISIKLNSKILKLNISDITYIESRKNNIEIHTIEKTYDVRDSIGKKENELQKYLFVRIHSGYLVNCMYLFSINSDSVTLDNGINLPLSRYRAYEVKAKFQEYIVNNYG